jgi:hypothetical protein
VPKNIESYMLSSITGTISGVVLGSN